MRYNIITIEREYASGGKEIGEKLADKLGIPCYGREILEQAADKLNLPPERLGEIEEKMTGSLLYSLVAFASISSGQTTDVLTLEQKLNLAENAVINDLTINPCVIIGRGASALLKDREKTLRVFIHADNKKRIDRAINVYGINPGNASTILQRYDKRRANYYKATTSIDWKNADMYHLFLNSGILGIDQTVEILYSTVI